MNFFCRKLLVGLGSIGPVSVELRLVELVLVWRVLMAPVSVELVLV